MLHFFNGLKQGDPLQCCFLVFEYSTLLHSTKEVWEELDFNF